MNKTLVILGNGFDLDLEDEEEQELPQIPFATFPCPAHVRA